jgi:hypothetical protein
MKNGLWVATAIAVSFLMTPTRSWASWPLNPDTCTTDPVGSKPTLPCTMEKDLLAAVNGQPTSYNWEGWLDSSFTSWQTGNFGSNNMPVLAAAIALWTNDTSFNAVSWFTTFLTCQNKSADCTVSNDLRYMMGHEIMSPIYHAYVAAAVASVNLWANTATGGPASGLGPLASQYLRNTSALYTLAAAPGPATTATYTLITRTGGTCGSTCALDGDTFSSAPTTLSCQPTSLYNGPFVDMAGARSGSTDPCDSNSDPFLARAIAWPGVTHAIEVYEQGNLLNTLESKWPSTITFNLYGNNAARRTLLQGHVNGTFNPGTLTEILVGTRYIREYYFISWPGTRASLLTNNPETCGSLTPECTAAMFAVVWNQSTSQATFLYPWWPSAFRSCVTSGLGTLLPNATSPTSIEAQNIDTGGGESATCYHGSQTVSVGLPTTAPSFEVVLTPTSDPFTQD